jgi:formate dehydrogenase subunit gamma
MAATTLPSADDTVVRFEGTERLVHWSTAALVTVCAFTALALSVSPVATLVGRRNLVRDVHVVCGLLIPLPLVIGRLGPWSGSLRATLRELDRFDAVDRTWLRSLGRDYRATPGKFHTGQKLNAALLAGALVLLLATGVALKWYEPFSIDLRRGATFVHDWVAFLLAIDLIAHVAKALGDPVALRAMWSGRAPRRWAAMKHPRWRV